MVKAAVCSRDLVTLYLASQVVGLIDAVVKEAASFLSATSATLFILDRETGTLWARRRGLPGTPNADHMQVDAYTISEMLRGALPVGRCQRAKTMTKMQTIHVMSKTALFTSFGIPMMPLLYERDYESTPFPRTRPLHEDNRRNIET